MNNEELARQREMLARIRAFLRTVLEKEAFERLERVKMVNPSLYSSAVQALYMLHQQGRLSKKLSDDDLKRLLSKLRGERKETRIRILEKGG